MYDGHPIAHPRPICESCYCCDVFGSNGVGRGSISAFRMYFFFCWDSAIDGRTNESWIEGRPIRWRGTKNCERALIRRDACLGHSAFCVDARRSRRVVYNQRRRRRCRRHCRPFTHASPSQPNLAWPGLYGLYGLYGSTNASCYCWNCCCWCCCPSRIDVDPINVRAAMMNNNIDSRREEDLPSNARRRHTSHNLEPKRVVNTQHLAKGVVWVCL